MSTAAFSSPSASGALDSFLQRALLLLAALVAAAAAVWGSGALSLARLPDGWGAMSPLLASPLQWTGLTRLAVAGGSGALGMAALALLLRPRVTRGARRAHIVDSDDQGVVLIENDSVVLLTTAALLSLRGVATADVTVVGSGTSPVRASVRVGVRPGIEAADLGQEARRVAFHSIEAVAGLDVHDVEVRVHVLNGDALLEAVGR